MGNPFADIFSIKVPAKPAAKLRTYRATWPCGSTWDFDRTDLEVPAFTNGEQNGVTHCYSSLKEALADLPAHGCTIHQIGGKA